MKRSISTLLTTLLFSAAIGSNAMAQRPASDFSVRWSPDTAAMPEQPTADAPKPAAPKPGMSSPYQTPLNAINPAKARAQISRASVDSSYPAYCPFLPAGAKPDDWEYREALENCLHGI